MIDYKSLYFQLYGEVVNITEQLIKVQKKYEELYITMVLDEVKKENNA